MGIAFKFVICLIAINAGKSVAAPFDYFKLVQQWPAGVCNIVNSKCQRNPLPNNFTIHGLWPDLKAQRIQRLCQGPSYAGISPPQFVAKLNLSWPDLEKPITTTNQSFWKHEWDFHGKCSKSLYPQQNYFNLALDLKDRFDLLRILQSNSILKGSYPLLSSVNAAIKRATGKTPELRCNAPAAAPNHPQGPLRQLMEVIICYDKFGISVIDCPTKTPFASCQSGVVYFP